jgi:hypothetical protein
MNEYFFLEGEYVTHHERGFFYGLSMLKKKPQQQPLINKKTQC